MRRSSRSTRNRISLFFSLLAPLLAPAALLTQTSGDTDAASFAVVGARVFDGERVLEGATVLVQDGRIAAVGGDVALPEGVPTVDGSGGTLLPGLIDAHTHTFGDALERALVFGVTTELDQFTHQGFAAVMRAEQQAGGAPGRADLFSAGTLVTAPGGHGTEYGVPIPTIERPEEAARFVADRLAEGSDWIKIVYESATAKPIPTVDRATLEAVIAAAHDQGALAVVHATTRKGFEEAVAAGADGLVHVFRDLPPAPDLGGKVKAAGTFVIPTLTITSRFSVTPGEPTLSADPALAPYLRGAERSHLAASFPARPGSEPSLDNALAAVRALHAAGVPILAGTDAPNPGTVHGASLHREIELLVRAGLTPAEALAAATSAPADAFGLEDRGRIAPGLRADLVLVDGDPTTDVTATRSILRVWKAGRESARPRVEEEASAGGPGPGPVSGFEDGDDGMGSRVGSGWQSTTDEMMGGTSTVEVAVAESGAGGAGRALEVAGELRAGFPYPWAGAMLSPGSAPMQPADLSAASGVAFQAQGDGGTYRLMVFARSLGQLPATATFTAGPEWTRHEVTWKELGLDGADVTGLIWTGGPEPGPFRFRIDDVELME